MLRFKFHQLQVSSCSSSFLFSSFRYLHHHNSSPPNPPLFTPSSLSSGLSTSIQPKFLAKLKEQQESTKTCLKFPSVMSMEDFVEEISNFKKFAQREMAARQEERRKRKIENVKERSLAMFHRGLPHSKNSSRGKPQHQDQEEDLFAAEQRERMMMSNRNNNNDDSTARDAFLNSLDLVALAQEVSNKIGPGMIKSYLVENKIWDTKMERLPLIPYQTAKELVLKSISDPEVRSYFDQFDCRYVEFDTFAHVKHYAINSSATRTAPHRIPIVTIMGHINHGKTTLLDSLQQSNIVETEPGLITQSIRAFTIHVGGGSEKNDEHTASDHHSNNKNNVTMDKLQSSSASRLASIPRAADGTGVLPRDNDNDHDEIIDGANKISIEDKSPTMSVVATKKKKKKRRLSPLSEKDLANSPFKTFFKSSSSSSSSPLPVDDAQKELQHQSNQTDGKKSFVSDDDSDGKWKQINQITFIDTPGHRIFAEMRLYGSRLSDVMLILVALDEGIQGQTEEIVRTALHFNKPVVIAFSKVDLFTDPVMLSRRLAQICDELRILGITVRFVDGEQQLVKTLNKLRDPHYLLNKAQNKYEATELQIKKNQQEKQRQETGIVEEKIEIDARTESKKSGGESESSSTSSSSAVNNQSQSTQQQQNHLHRLHHREALAICISASKGINISLLIRALQHIAGHDSLPRASPASYPAQAVVLESFRDFSSLADHPPPQQEQQSQSSSSSSQKRKREGPVNIVALIRNGTLRTGAPFVCDMGWGVIDRVTNTWGDTLLYSSSSSASLTSTQNILLDEDVSNESLLPGAAVVVFGSKDTTCPGPLTHIIEVESPEKAEFISKFRNRQRFFIERHPSLVHLMRPQNKKSEFLHVGNYGQQDPELAFDYNVLVKEAKTPEVKESPLEAQWRANQLKPEEQPKNEAEYSELVKNSKVLQVMVKVDGYNSARTAMREIPKLMTKNVVINVISIGFGPLSHKDVEKFGGVDIVVMFRAPRLRDAQAHLVLENRKIKYGEFDVYSEMLEWLKKVVLEVQAQESLKRSPQREADKNVITSDLKAAGYLDDKKGKMRTAQQMTPSLEQRLSRKHEDARRDKFLKTS